MDAVVEVVAGSPGARVVLTCEHASLNLPSPWAWPEADRWLVGTHWSYDLGVAHLVRALADKARWPAVLSGVSRLLVDCNRPLQDPTLFRTEAEGRLVHLNAGLSDEERERRIHTAWKPYHAAVDRVVAAHPEAAVVSMHSFTPIYEGKRRELEIGVLFDRDEDAGRALALLLNDAGYHVRLNEPYSGKLGLIFSAEHHALDHDRLALELEIRQDLLLDELWVADLVPVLHRAILEVV
jgi:predicted N-formylglutamate amidohydrolase